MFKHYKLLILLVIFEVLVVTSDFEIPNLPKPEVYTEVIRLETGPILDKKESDTMTAYNPIERGALKIANAYSTINYPEALDLLNVVYREAPSNGFKPEFILGVILSESTFKRFVVSHAGAKGYMQVIPKWHRDRLKGRSVFDTVANVEAGTGFLRECISRKGNLHGGLACYNGSDSRASSDRYNNKVRRNTIKMANLLASN